MIGIYKISSPTGKVYIGQSVNIYKRFIGYKGLNCKDQSILYKSFLKHGVENHFFEIIEECEIHLLNERERYWQEFFTCVGPKGLNCVYVQTNDKKSIVSDDLREKRRKFMIGKKFSKETIEKLKKPKSDEHKLKMSINAKNRSSETIKKQSISLSKNLENNKRLLECNLKRRKKIEVLDFLTGEKKFEFDSIRECSRILKCDRKSIKLSCDNIYPYAYGFKFNYL
jgi:group I intron endonuclease